MPTAANTGTKFDREGNSLHVAAGTAHYLTSSQNAALGHVSDTSTVIFFMGPRQRVAAHYRTSDRQLDEEVQAAIRMAKEHDATTRVLSWSPDAMRAVDLGSGLRAALEHTEVTAMTLPQQWIHEPRFWQFVLLAKTTVVKMMELRPDDEDHPSGSCSLMRTDWWAGVGSSLYVKKQRRVGLTVAGVNGGAALFVFCPHGHVAAHLPPLPANQPSSAWYQREVAEAVTLALRHSLTSLQPLRALVYAPTEAMGQAVLDAVKAEVVRGPWQVELSPPETYRYRASPADSWDFEIRRDAERAEIWGGWAPSPGHRSSS